jgi:hypothetical protein
MIGLSLQKTALFAALALCALAALPPLQADAALVRTARLTESVSNETFPNTSAAFTPSSDSLLVVVLSMWDLAELGADSSLTLDKVGGGLGATKRATIRNDGGQWVTTIWTAPIGSAASMQLVLDGYADDAYFIMRVYDYTGYDTSSPIGGTATGKGFAADSLTLSSAPALTSEVMGVMSAAADFSGIAPGAAGFGEIADSSVSGVLLSQNQTRTNSVSTTVDWSVTGGSDGDDKSSAAIEIKEAAAATGPSTLSRPPNNLGLVGYWSFDDATSTRATDFSGNGNHGTLNGFTHPPTASSGWTNGKRSKALQFDGVDDYVTASIPATSEFTIALWVRASQAISGEVQLFTESTCGCGDELGLSNVNGVFHAWGDSAGSLLGTTEAQPNTWYHVVISNGASTRTLYVNGVAEGTDDSSGGTGAVPVNIGQYNSNRYFPGTIDDVRFYNRALTAVEVAALGRSGAVRFTSNSKTLTQGSSLESGLVGLWTFDGADVRWSSATAGTAYDRSGNNNNGTITNMNQKTGVAGGVLGQAFSFDDVDDVVDMTSNVIGANTVTVCAWGKQSSAGAFDAFVGFEGGFIFSLTTIFGGNRASVTNDGGSTNVSSASISNFLNTWHHYCAVRTSAATNNTNIYVDGTLSGSANQSAGTPTTGFGNGAIGNRDSGGYAFNGLLDDVRIYNRALTTAEIQQLYRLGQAKITQ